MVKFIESDLFKAMCAIFLCAMILNIPAFMNGFVFLFPDSADYLSSRIYIFRLPIYGTFAKIGILTKSVWTIAIAQSIILCHLIYLINKSIFGKVNIAFFIFQTIALTAISSLPYFAAFMMADIFTSILFLGLFLLIFFEKSLGKFNYFYLHGLIIFAAMAHITNIYLGMGLIIFASFIHFARKFHFKTASAQILRPISLILIAAGFITSMNFYYFKTFSLSPSSSVFTLANLVEQGSAKTYLQNVCPSADLKICQYVEALPNNVDKFLWGRNSLTHKLGSFTGLRSEAKLIVRNTITNYPKDVALHTLSYIVKSFSVHTPAKEINSSVTKTSVIAVLKIYYGEKALLSFLNSKQANDDLNYDEIAKIDNWVFPISLLSVFILSFVSLIKINDNRFLLPLFTLVMVIGNNVLCSAASGLFDRYQARVSWLLVFAIIIMVGTIFMGQYKASSKEQSIAI